MDVEQFKEDVEKILQKVWESGKQYSQVFDFLECSTREHWLKEILAHPFLAPYLKLLGQTRETCRDCHGDGAERLKTDFGLGIIVTARKCPTCHGTGSIYHPERLVVLNARELHILENCSGHHL